MNNHHHYNRFTAGAIVLRAVSATAFVAVALACWHIVSAILTLTA